MSATLACSVSTVLLTAKEESSFSREGMVKMLPALPKRPLPMVCRRSNNLSSVRLTPLVAKENSFDVVLIDTAGRMQDNEPLMRALAKVGLQYFSLDVQFPNTYQLQLVAVNNPDKIIFVGEALVGNEAVDQLTKFDRALRDFSSASGSGKGRGIDGMLVTKWDTVDDKVCCLG